MFSYVDPSIKQELIARGQLVCIDEAGKRCTKGGTDHPFISLVGPIPLPVSLPSGPTTFRWYAWVRNADLGRIEDVVKGAKESGPQLVLGLLNGHMAVNSALVYGDFVGAETPLVRVHSNCLTGDVFGSLRCDCGPQLQAALEAIRHEGAGALIYMAGHEGRGIGLWAKAITYLLQDSGHDTYQANEQLGLPADTRDFGDAGRVLVFLREGTKPIRLLGNNPLKRSGIEAQGVQVHGQVPLVVGVNPFNVRYLNSKRGHGHLIPHGAVLAVEPKPAGSNNDDSTHRR